MHITKVHAKNFLSFEELDLEFNEELSIIVGPNGSGKTNLLRLIEFVSKVLAGRYDANARQLYRRSQDREFTIEVSIKLANEELSLVKNYIFLLILSQVINEFTTKTSEWKDTFEHLMKCGENIIKGLPEFKIHIESEPTPWQILSYIELKLEPESSGLTLYYDLSNFFTVNPRETPEDVARLLETVQLYEVIKNYYDVNKDSSECALESIIKWAVQQRGGHPLKFHDNAVSWRDISQALQHPDLLNYRNRISMRLEYLFNELSRRGYKANDITFGSLVAVIFNSSISILRNPRAPPRPEVDLDEQGNTETEQSFPEIPGIRVVEGPEVTLTLFNAYTSGNPNILKLYNDVDEHLSKLTKYRLNLSLITRQVNEEECGIVLRSPGSSVTQGLGALFNASSNESALAVGRITRPREHHYAVLRLVDDHGRVLPLDFAPAGVVELVSVLAAALSVRDGIVLLDEPAHNLHPTLQSELRDQLRNIARNLNNQLVIITHSPAFLDPHNLVNTHVLRFVLTKEGTKVIKVHEKLQSLKGMSEDIMKWPIKTRKLLEALFAKGAVITEGDAEEAAIEEWLPKHGECRDEHGNKIELQDVVVINAGGSCSIERHAELLKSWEVPYVVFADEDTAQKIEKKKEENNELYNELMKHAVFLRGKKFCLYAKSMKPEEYMEACKECGNKNCDDNEQCSDNSCIGLVFARLTNPPNEACEAFKKLSIEINSLK